MSRRPRRTAARKRLRPSLCSDGFRERFALPTQRLIRDTANGMAKFLAWLVAEQGIEPHVSIWYVAERSDFHFDAVAPAHRGAG